MVAADTMKMDMRWQSRSQVKEHTGRQCVEKTNGETIDRIYEFQTRNEIEMWTDQEVEEFSLIDRRELVGGRLANFCARAFQRTGAW